MNSFAPIDPALIDVVLPPSGYPDELAAEDTRDALWDVCGSASRAFPKSLWIEPKDWADKARDNDKYGTWPANYLDRFTNQNPTHECTCHSLRANFEAARNRARGVNYPDGAKKGYRYPESAQFGSVWVSAKSIYDQVNPKTARNPRQQGGANVRQVLEVACRTGMLPDKTQPFAYGFEHDWHGTSGQGNTNQSSGPYSSKSDFPDGWEETAKLLMPEEVIFPEMFEQAVCLVLHGIVDSVGRNGHAVPHCRLIFEGNALKAAEYDDSYDLKRYDSVATMRRAWQGSFGIATTTVPDDWSKPAG
jgi:hypothetical protein